MEKTKTSLEQLAELLDAAKEQELLCNIDITNIQMLYNLAKNKKHQDFLQFVNPLIENLQNVAETSQFYQTKFKKYGAIIMAIDYLTKIRDEQNA